MIVAQFVAVIIIGYLLGSIPFGLLVGRLSGKADIRQYGSGRTGATNVLRTAGRKAALLVAILDVGKGAVAVVFAGLIVGKSYLVVGDLALGMLVAQVAAALAALAGHIWPVFLRFRGGRGVATFFGGLAALNPVAAAFGGVILLAGVGITRFASVGSIAGAVGTCAILVPLTILNGSPVEYLAYALIGAIIIIVMHRDNIGRLVSGTERRIGEKVVLGDSPNSAHRQSKASQETPSGGRR